MPKDLTFTEEYVGNYGGAGHVLCRCRNHQQKRWFMKDPRTAGSRISQNIGLHYLGDLETRMHASAFQKPNDEEFVKAMEEIGYSHECSCPFKDLEWWDGVNWIAL